MMNDLVAQTSRTLAAIKFYHFSQNNSGGSFVLDERRGLTHNVIVEAYSADDANARAIELGIYFNGCATGNDCSCCGDRWSSQYSDSDGTSVPTIYDEPVETHSSWVAWMKPGKETAVHYIDGRIEWFGVFTKA
jgi:hypothetical protein